MREIDIGVVYRVRCRLCMKLLIMLPCHHLLAGTEAGEFDGGQARIVLPGKSDGALCRRLDELPAKIGFTSVVSTTRPLASHTPKPGNAPQACVPAAVYVHT